ncbi:MULTISPECIES: RhuM family protein [unclassified Neisseria]|uniref:RhuM family protein n=1 Tax=unclassified Neisseria TaxID=2623750 RepID=UPI00142FC7DD|nr:MULTISPECIES: RhuM family protein [unclassified Neisseria]MBF0803241.1 virulence RhuM family protein [Neisseria sp. 19428wB4_WF04]
MQKMHIASADRPVTFYDLETIISAGYRIKSPHGVAFRRWATGRLKDYLPKGYTLNQKRLQQNAGELHQALALIQKTAASPDNHTKRARAGGYCQPLHANVFVVAAI